MEIKMNPVFGNRPAVVRTISVKVGDKVKANDVLMNVETGKGNNIIKSKIDGVVSSVLVKEGDEVKTGQDLVVIEEETTKVETKDTTINMNPVFGNKPAIVGTINVKVNDIVEVGTVIMNVETGKGNNIIKTKVAGTIKEILVKEGEEVKTNTPLVVVSEEVACEETKEEVKATKAKQAELLILGAGPGGYVAALYAAKKGLKVTLVEKNKLGGTCLNVGCIPTKSLVKSSEMYLETLHLKDFGIDLEGKPTYDMKNLVARKDKVVSTLVGGIDSLMKSNDVEVIYGTASFKDKDHVEVKTETEVLDVTYKDVIIATGSKIAKPNIPGIDLPCVLNSTSALANKENLESITIVGGGVIGMEFACLYRNLGIKVTVIEFLDRLLAMLDNDVTDEFTRLCEEKGIEVHVSSGVKKIQTSTDNKAVITYEHEGKEYIVVSDKVLVATGRLPRMDELNIEATGCTLNDRGRGIKVDGHMKTSVDHIYAIGDVTNIIQLAHVAEHQGICAVNNILGQDVEMDYNAVPSVTFTSPEIANVGKTENDCKKLGIKYKVGRFDFVGNGKALTMNKTEGFAKLIQDAETGVIIGGCIFGADASSLVSTLAVAIQNKLTDKEINETIFAHPTTTEVVMEASLDLSIGALHQ